MATPGPAAPPVPTTAPRDDWAAQAADTIDRVVTGIGDKTTKPLIAVAAAVVYGVILAAVGATILVLVAIALVRLAVVYNPFIDDYPRRVWVAEAVWGGIFSLIGLFVWRKRRPKNKS